MTSTGPDCHTCWKRSSCAMARDGGFCMAWQSREPQPRGQDWAEAWSRGEEEGRTTKSPILSTIREPGSGCG